MKRLYIIGMTTLLLAPLQGMASTGVWDWFSFKHIKGVEPVSSAQYSEECGSCHFAYQPGLLPARSWKKLFEAKQLEDHFGENAELDEETRKGLLNYSIENAADGSIYKRSRKVMSSTPDDATPLRITDVRYIKRKHDKIPAKLIKQNPEVKSLSFCDTCHTQATKGIYDDDTVSIKGHGPWDD